MRVVDEVGTHLSGSVNDLALVFYAVELNELGHHVLKGGVIFCLESIFNKSKKEICFP